MKIKALLLGLIIAGATVFSYVHTDNTDSLQGPVDARKIKVPKHE